MKVFTSDELRAKSRNKHPLFTKKHNQYLINILEVSIYIFTIINEQTKKKRKTN